MLIWPENEELKVTIGDVYGYACNALELSFSIIPEGKERTLVDHLMDYCTNQVKDDEQLSRALRVLRETAVLWNDAPLLLRAAKACKAEFRSNFFWLIQCTIVQSLFYVHPIFALFLIHFLNSQH